MNPQIANDGQGPRATEDHPNQANPYGTDSRCLEKTFPYVPRFSFKTSLHTKTSDCPEVIGDIGDTKAKAGEIGRVWALTSRQQYSVDKFTVYTMFLLFSCRVALLD